MNFPLHYQLVSKIIFHGQNYVNRLVARVLSKVTRHHLPIDKGIFLHQLQTSLGDFNDFTIGLNHQQKILAEADKIIGGTIQVFNKTVEFELFPDWHHDFIHDFRWSPGRFYKDYSIVNSDKSDIKVVWDLSRAHFLLTIGQAYLISKDDKYAHAIKKIILNWIDQNPFQYSVNWTCSMDVAIRGINWLYAVQMVNKSAEIDQDFINKLHTSIFLHAKHIAENLEKSFPYSANHYAANLTGLVLFSHVVNPQLQQVRGWKSFSVPEFFHELRVQVLPSGAHFERSFSYHRLVTELFFFTYLVLLRNGIYLPKDCIIRIRSMFDHMQKYVKLNGTAPQLGDDDDGRLLPFSEQEPNFHQHTMEIGLVHFYPALYSRVSDCAAVDAFFYLGFLNPETGEIPTVKQRGDFLMEDVGVAVVKNNESYLMVTNSEPSKYIDVTKSVVGSHTHADLMSFEFVKDGYNLFVDAGTFCYTSDYKTRNLFRSTQLHNTLSVDGLSQHTILENDVFSYQGIALPTTFSMRMLEQEVKIDASSTAYDQLKIKHHRSFSFNHDSNSLKIVDRIDTTSLHSFQFLFNCPGIFEITKESDNFKFIVNGYKIATLRWESDLLLNTELRDCILSDRYNSKTNGSQLVFQVNSDRNFELNFLIE